MNAVVVDINPNESTGGAGCLCSETQITDTKGPFVVFFGDSEMDSAVSPVPVLCAGCARSAVKLLDQRVKPKPAPRRPRKETLEPRELPEL